MIRIVRFKDLVHGRDSTDVVIGWYCIRYWWRDNWRSPYLRMGFMPIGGIGKFSFQIMRTFNHPKFQFRRKRWPNHATRGGTEQ